MTDRESKKLSEKAEQAIIEQALSQYKEGFDADKSEIELAQKDLEFAHNENNCQWDSKVKQAREQDNPPRPCLSLNKIPEKIDQVEGEFRQLKPSFKIRGVDSAADPKTAEIISGIIRFIEWNSDGRNAYNTSHSSTLYCGRGAWRIDIVDCEEDPFQRDIVINRVTNPLSIIVDPNCKKLDKSDADFMFITEQMTKEKYEKNYPDAPIENWADNLKEADGWRTKNEIRVVEYWYKETGEETFYRVSRYTDGIASEMTVDEKGLLETDIVLKKKKASRPRVKWCKMTNNKVLAGPFDWPSKYFPIIIETGKELFIKGHSKKRGMVRHAKTPQEMYNYWSSALTEQVALQPKAPYQVTAGMIDGYEHIWDNANNKNFPYLPYKPDTQMPGVSPKREAPPQMSVAMASELQRMSHDIMAAMGIYQASLGDSGPEKSGRAIFARQRQGSTGSFTFTDNFGAALVYSMKVLIDLIPYVYDTERIIRIVGDDGQERTVPINARPTANIVQEFEGLQPGASGYIHDMNIGKYDAVVTIGPSYATQREELATVLGEIIKSMPANIGAVLLETFVKTLDMPNSDVIAQKIQQAMTQGNGPSPDQMLAQKKLELEGIEEMRKGFEAKIEAISKLMHAEAAERGQQMKEVASFVEELRHRMEMNAPAQNNVPSAMAGQKVPLEPGI